MPSKMFSRTLSCTRRTVPTSVPSAAALAWCARRQGLVRDRRSRRSSSIRQKRHHAEAPSASAKASAPRRRITAVMVIVLGIDPGTANTGYGVVARARAHLRALDGGVIRRRPGEPLEAPARRDPRARERADRRARARGDGGRGPLLRRKRAHARSRSGRRAARCCSPPASAGIPCCSLHAAAIKRRRLRERPRRQGPGPADGRGRCWRSTSRPRPTTRPTRSRWRSATPTARRCAAALTRMIALVEGNGRGAPAATTSWSSCAGVGYRLAVSAETLQARARGGQASRCSTRHLVVRDDGCSSTASPPRRSASCSCS